MDVSKYRTRCPPREHEEAVRMLLENLDKQVPQQTIDLKKSTPKTNNNNNNNNQNQNNNNNNNENHFTNSNNKPAANQHRPQAASKRPAAAAAGPRRQTMPASNRHQQQQQQQLSDASHDDVVSSNSFSTATSLSTTDTSNSNYGDHHHHHRQQQQQLQESPSTSLSHQDLIEISSPIQAPKRQHQRAAPKSKPGLQGVARPPRMQSKGTSTSDESSSRSLFDERAPISSLDDLARGANGDNGNNGNGNGNGNDQYEAIPSRTIAVQCDLKASSVVRRGDGSASGGQLVDRTPTDLASMQASSISSTRYGFYRLTPEAVEERRRRAGGDSRSSRPAPGRNPAQLAAGRSADARTSMGAGPSADQYGDDDDEVDSEDQEAGADHVLLSGAPATRGMKRGQSIDDDDDRWLEAPAARDHPARLERPRTALSYVSTSRLRHDGRAGHGADSASSSPDRTTGDPSQQRQYRGPVAAGAELDCYRRGRQDESRLMRSKALSQQVLSSASRDDDAVASRPADRRYGGRHHQHQQDHDHRRRSPRRQGPSGSQSDDSGELASATDHSAADRHRLPQREELVVSSSAGGGGGGGGGRLRRAHAPEGSSLDRSTRQPASEAGQQRQGASMTLDRHTKSSRFGAPRGRNYYDATPLTRRPAGGADLRRSRVGNVLDDEEHEHHSRLLHDTISAPGHHQAYKHPETNSYQEDSLTPNPMVLPTTSDVDADVGEHEHGQAHESMVGGRGRRRLINEGDDAIRLPNEQAASRRQQSLQQQQPQPQPVRYSSMSLSRRPLIDQHGRSCQYQADGGRAAALAAAGRPATLTRPCRLARAGQQQQLLRSNSQAVGGPSPMVYRSTSMRKVQGGPLARDRDLDGHYDDDDDHHHHQLYPDPEGHLGTPSPAKSWANPATESSRRGQQQQQSAEKRFPGRSKLAQAERSYSMRNVSKPMYHDDGDDDDGDTSLDHHLYLGEAYDDEDLERGGGDFGRHQADQAQGRRGRGRKQEQDFQCNWDSSVHSDEAPEAGLDLGLDAAEDEDDCRTSRQAFSRAARAGLHRPLDYDSQHRLNESGLPETNSLQSSSDSSAAAAAAANLLTGRDRARQHHAAASCLGLVSSTPTAAAAASSSSSSSSSAAMGASRRLAATAGQDHHHHQLDYMTLAAGGGGRQPPMLAASGRGITGRALSQQSLTRPSMPLMAGGRRLRRHNAASTGHQSAGSDVGGSSVSLSHHGHRYENAHTRTPVVMLIPEARPAAAATTTGTGASGSQNGSLLSAASTSSAASSIHNLSGHSRAASSRRSGTGGSRRSRSLIKSRSMQDTTGGFVRSRKSSLGRSSDTDHQHQSSMLRTLLRPPGGGAGGYSSSHRRASSRTRARASAARLASGSGGGGGGGHQSHRDEGLEEDADGVGQLASEMEGYKFRRRYSVPKDAKINWFAKLRQRVISSKS